MRSFIIIEVEHGEDTDALELMAAQVCRNAVNFGATVEDYSVRVDLPPYLTARSLTAHGLALDVPR